MTFAKITLIGRLGDAPVLRKGNNDTKFATGRIAVNRGSGETQSTLWFDVSVDGDGRATNFAGAKKGDAVFVQGMLSTRVTEDGKTYLRVTVDDFRLLPKGPEDESVVPFAKATIVGRLGDQPKVKPGNEGDFAAGRIAVNRGSGDNQETNWFDITVDGDRRMQVFTEAQTGSSVYVDGYFSTRVHEGVTYMRVSVDTFRVFNTGQSAA